MTREMLTFIATVAVSVGMATSLAQPSTATEGSQPETVAPLAGRPTLGMPDRVLRSGYFVSETRRPVFEGSAPRDAVTVEILDGRRVLGMGRVESGRWRASSESLAPGRHRVVAIAVDASGRRSEPSAARYVVIADPDVRPLPPLSPPGGLVIEGPQAGDLLGYSVAAGDVNADGISDLAVVSPNATDAETGGRGIVYVIFGRPDFAQSPPHLDNLDGENGFRIVGSALAHHPLSVAPGGDVNGDGIDDLVIGSINGEGSAKIAARITVLFGRDAGFPSLVRLMRIAAPAGLVIHAWRGDGFFGEEISGGRDFNSDGLDDVLIGAPLHADCGAAYVVFGQAGGWPEPLSLRDLSAPAGAKITCSSRGALFGTSVAPAGDLNGDGIEDLSIGAIRARRGGAAYVIYGLEEGTRFPTDIASMQEVQGFEMTAPTSTFGSFGRSISGGEDLDGDGIDDLAVASDENIVVVLHGRNGTFTGRFSTIGKSTSYLKAFTQSYDGGPVSVHLSPDHDGDGRADLVTTVTEFRETDDGPATSAFVLFGQGKKHTSLLPLEGVTAPKGFRLDAEADSGELRPTSADLNGDGGVDLVFGAPFAVRSGRADAGAVYVVFGSQD